MLLLQQFSSWSSSACIIPSSNCLREEETGETFKTNRRKIRLRKMKLGDRLTALIDISVRSIHPFFNTFPALCVS